MDNDNGKCNGKGKENPPPQKNFPFGWKTMNVPVPLQNKQSDFKNHFNEWRRCAKLTFEKVKILKDRFTSDGPNELPPFEQIFTAKVWEIPEMAQLRDKLNAVKDNLNDVDLVPWRLHTRNMSQMYLLNHNLKENFNVEFLSKSWCKMTEMLRGDPIIPPFVLNAFGEGQNPTLKSVHLCETPGAFVSAINHYVHSFHRGLKWSWLATSMNPYYEGNQIDPMVEDDSVIRATFKRWYFLEDNSGNLLCRKNFESLLTKVKKEYGANVHFVTADGSFDCQPNPGAQEVDVSHLQFAEIVATVSILGIGGSFVLKIFTFFECSTICNIYLLYCLFEKVKLCKPSISKEGNSEVYVICIGFRGKPDGFDKFLNYVGPDFPKYEGDELTLFPMDSIPSFFIDKLIKAAEFFATTQENIIMLNLRTYQKAPVNLYASIRVHQKALVEDWLKRCSPRRLDPNLRLCPAERYQIRSRELMTSRYFKCLDLVDFDAENIREWVEGQFTIGPKSKLDQLITSQTLVFNIKGSFKIENSRLGKRYENIHCSAFCFPFLLCWRDQIKEFIQKHSWLVSLSEDADASGTMHCSADLNKQKLQPLVTQYQGSDPWVLQKNLCYHETLEDLTYETDMELSQSGFKALINALKEVEIGNSMFLCEFTLLTRLQNGFIFAISSFFTETIICFNQQTQIQGVFLYKFKGFEEQPWQLSSLETILENLGQEDDEKVVLECLPTFRFIGDQKILPYLKMYNLLNVSTGIHKHADRIYAGGLKDKEKQQIKMLRLELRRNFLAGQMKMEE